MRKLEQKKLLDLLEVASRGVVSAAKKAPQPEAAAVLQDCLLAFETIETAACGSAAADRRKLYKNIIGHIKSRIQGMAQQLPGQHPACNLEPFCQYAGRLKEELLSGKELQYLVVFLPYKASMWDAMESIWRAAKEDTRCITCVAPVPYFERNADHTFGSMKYEGDKMPAYVELTDCMALDLPQIRPDIVYFHNPYDEYNYVTSVHPAFYSSELKKCTDLLVYVPYFISGAYPTVEGAAVFCQTSGMYRSDLIIAQSEVQKELFIQNGHCADKIAVFGSPKFDYALAHFGNASIPDAWQQKLAGKKVFLVCNSVGPFLADEKTIVLYDALIHCLIQEYHAAVIYRPHPLLEVTVKAMRPQKYGQYMDFIHKYRENENFVLDDTGDMACAACASDCMVSDYSSVCFSFAATGKPVAMTLNADAPPEGMYYAFDYRGLYFVNTSGCLQNGWIPGSFREFVKNMINGDDGKKENRMARMKRSVANLDGTCGRKIHEYTIGIQEGSQSEKR